ncbi:MAG: rhomboid family intramembrane serine protease, partial [Streptosporangiaceae bacterium]|nr:rhomboid family intramembrane serine protease [Streptosporangiaceae bacterium]
MSAPGPSDGQATENAAVPTCFRHPGRETYVSCVRCGRHACPDCLRSAAVGQQCVECVREGGRDVRQARTTFGGRPSLTARVTWALVAINVVLFVIELARPGIATDLGLLGQATYTVGGPAHGIAAGEYYRLVTSAFLPPATGLGGLGFLDIVFNL